MNQVFEVVLTPPCCPSVEYCPRFLSDTCSTQTQPLLEGTFYFCSKAARRFLFVPPNKIRSVRAPAGSGSDKFCWIEENRHFHSLPLSTSTCLSAAYHDCQPPRCSICSIYPCSFLEERFSRPQSPPTNAPCLHEHLPASRLLCSEPMWCFDVVSLCQIQ